MLLLTLLACDPETEATRYLEGQGLGQVELEHVSPDGEEDVWEFQAQRAQERCYGTVRVKRSSVSHEMGCIPPAGPQELVLPENVNDATLGLARACDQGTVAACSDLGTAYTLGDLGLAHDPVRGTRLFEQACEGGNALACANLARHLLDGVGAPKDAPRALELGLDACTQGAVPGCDLSGVMLVLGATGVEADPSRAVPLLEKGCAGGFGHSCLNLATLYDKGTGVKPSAVKGREYLERGCASKSRRSCVLAAKAQEEGIGGPKDLSAARESHQRACALGEKMSCLKAQEGQ